MKPWTIFILAFGVASCGGDGGSSNSQKPAPTRTQEIIASLKPRLPQGMYEGQTESGDACQVVVRYERQGSPAVEVEVINEFSGKSVTFLLKNNETGKMHKKINSEDQINISFLGSTDDQYLYTLYVGFESGQLDYVWVYSEESSGAGLAHLKCNLHNG